MSSYLIQEKPGANALDTAISGRVWRIGLGTSAFLLADAAFGLGFVSAQVSGDGSFGTLVNGSLTDSCTAAVCQIEGGLQSDSGSALFHSFDEFSPGATQSQSALFIDPGVRDIIVRVTGGNESFINGLLAASTGSSANLFVVNPGGIRLGADASLDIGGSFTASTANEVLFEDGIALNAGSATPPPSSLLTVSAPIGLGFLSGSQNSQSVTGSSSGAISVEGNGNLLVFGTPDIESQFVNRAFQTPQPPPVPFPLPSYSEFAVAPGNDIALIGNGVFVRGANLAAFGGQIAVGSVESGTVLFSPNQRTANNPMGNLDYSQVNAFADIALNNRASLDVSDGRSGSVSLQGRNITVADGSAILAETLPGLGNPPAGNSGLIDIAATDLILLTGSPNEPMGPLPFIPSYLSVDVAPQATGKGGRVQLRSRDLTIENGAQIGANTFGAGNAGLLDLSVIDDINITGGNLVSPSGVFSATTEIATGDAGQIDINTGSLTLQQSGRVSTSSLDSERSPGSSVGASGSINITARRTVSVLGNRPVEAFFSPSSPPEIVLAPSLIESSTGESARRQGGDITLSTEQLIVSNGGGIISITEGTAAGGNITISATDATVSKLVTGDNVNGITTTTSPFSTGNGGNLTLNIDQLSVVDTQVTTTTTGGGNAGDLLVNSDRIFISGSTGGGVQGPAGSPAGRSGLFASALAGTGNGGDLTVNTNVLRVTNGGTLSVSTFPSLTPGLPPGQGAAGNLNVNAQQIRLEEGSVLNASTAAGDRGNITLNTTDLLSLSDESLITANASGSATGGNITINAPDGFVVTTPEDNSDITANAVLGNGGQVNITARSILGIEPRAELTSASDITASSEFGVAGETRVEAVDSEVPEEPSPLPEPVEIAQVAQGCSAAGGSGRFVQTGRGGVGTTPYGILNSRESLSDVSLPDSLRAVVGNAQQAELPEPEIAESEIAEAQGWSVDDSGNVVLMAALDGEHEGDRCLSWRS